MAINLAALKTELTTDPNAYGYAPLIAAGNAEGLAALLNLRRAAITIRRTDVRPREVLEAIDLRDLTATPAQVNNQALAASWFESVTQGDATIRLSNDDGTDSLLKDNLDRLIGNTNASQTRLNAVARRDGSRAEQLWGRDAEVSYLDVGAALGLPQ